NLEHIREGNRNYIISGGGCKTNRASSGRRSEYVNQAIGFTMLNITYSKKVYADFYTVLDSMKLDHHSSLLDYSPANPQDTLTADIITAVNLPDSVTKPANAELKPIHAVY